MPIFYSRSSFQSRVCLQDAKEYHNYFALNRTLFIVVIVHLLLRFSCYF